MKPNRLLIATLASALIVSCAGSKDDTSTTVTDTTKTVDVITKSDTTTTVVSNEGKSVQAAVGKDEIQTMPTVTTRSDQDKGTTSKPKELTSAEKEQKRQEILENIRKKQAKQSKTSSVPQQMKSSPKAKMMMVQESYDMSYNIAPQMRMGAMSPAAMPGEFNTEEYSNIVENEFRRVTDEPLSTFSIDVDGASFSNVRRFLRDNRKPPVDAVRVEEFINYFSYDYPAPKGTDPFSITTEVGKCPWNENHQLVHIGLQGMKVDMSQMPKSNLVFLLDVSGSMNSPDKLPLLKKSLKMLVQEMRPEDRIAIVVYAGAAGLVLPSTSATESATIEAALERLSAGGSTAGAAGINLAYKVAKENFIKGGNNRVILATDGDFNVGVSSESELVKLIEEKRNDDIFLTVLGFGSGNYSDARMEQLSNKGNGNYAYIDNILEAKKVLVQEMGGTLLTIAKDVKLQVEFNPAKVASYRLIGYENRKLNNEDFNDDTKDAGELGAGHTVTALYEIVPVGAEKDTLPKVDDLKYQTESKVKGNSRELLTVKFRYKKPDGDKSILLSQVLTEKQKGGKELDWAASMAGFAMLLRKSPNAGTLTWNEVLTLARNARGEDARGYRAEAIRMIEQAELLYQ